jgi:hypothetical protein
LLRRVLREVALRVRFWSRSGVVLQSVLSLPGGI